MSLSVCCLKRHLGNEIVDLSSYTCIIAISAGVFRLFF